MITNYFTFDCDTFILIYDINLWYGFSSKHEELVAYVREGIQFNTIFELNICLNKMLGRWVIYTSSFKTFIWQYKHFFSIRSYYASWWPLLMKSLFLSNPFSLFHIQRVNSFIFKNKINRIKMLDNSCRLIWRKTYFGKYF